MTPPSRWRWTAPLLCALVGAALWSAWPQGQSSEGPEAQAIHGAAGYAWMHLALDRANDVVGLPVAIARETGGIRCRRGESGQRILVLTFQREAARLAYGAYALVGAKSDLLLDPPLEGDPIGWPDRDHVAALAYQLTLAGLDEARARRAVEEHAAWFEDGLRVFLVIPRKAAEAVNLFAAIPQGSDGPYLLLVVVDLQLP